MAKARKTPNGKYRVQVYDKETGKRKSFTADTARQANYLAMQWQEGKRESELRGPSVGDAVDRYIEGRDGVLSPTTIQAYRRMSRDYISPFVRQVPVSKVDRHLVQEMIAELSNKISVRTGNPISAKTIHNFHGLLVAALKETDPDLRIDTALPKIQKRFIELPPVDDVIRAVKGTDIELPCMLAMWLSLSMSEIRGINVDNIRDGVLTIKESVVDVDNVPVHKEATKAYDRTRRLSVPPYIMRLIEKTDAFKMGAGYIEPRTSNAIMARFRRVLQAAGVRHMTFHQLRHMNASVMAALGVPNLYAQERGGWSTDHTLKRVYQHTFSQQRIEVDKMVDSFFESKVQQKIEHKSRKESTKNCT